MSMNTFMLIAPRLGRQVQPFLRHNCSSLLPFGRASLAILLRPSNVISSPAAYRTKTLSSAANSMHTHALGQQRLQQLAQSLKWRLQSSKFYSTKIKKLAQPKKPVLKPAPMKPTPAPPKSTPSRTSPAQQLQQQQAHVPVYVAPSKTALLLPFEQELLRSEKVLFQCRNWSTIFLCYALVGGAVAWGFWTYMFYIRDLPDWSPQWTKFVAGAGITVALFAAIYAVFISTRLVNAIVSIPRSNSNGFKLEIQTPSWVPFRVRTINASAREVTIHKGFFAEKRSLTAAAKTLDDRSNETLGGMLARVALAPFRKLRDRISMEHYVWVNVKGTRQPYFMDKRGFVWHKERRYLEDMFDKRRWEN